MKQRWEHKMGWVMSSGHLPKTISKYWFCVPTVMLTFLSSLSLSKPLPCQKSIIFQQNPNCKLGTMRKRMTVDGCLAAPKWIIETNEEFFNLDGRWQKYSSLNKSFRIFLNENLCEWYLSISHRHQRVDKSLNINRKSLESMAEEHVQFWSTFRFPHSLKSFI